MHKALQGFLGTITASFAYLLGATLFWLTVWGAARLSFAARREDVEDASELVLEAPGRCYVAGVGVLALGWFLAAIAGGLGPLGVLLLLWWIRQVFRGLLAWMLLRGRQVRAQLEGDPGTDAEALRDGVKATAMASLFPGLGWAVLFMAALQGAGAECLRSFGRRATGKPAAPPAEASG